MAEQDPEYTQKRKRNNESVKKCREKEKEKISATEKKTKELKNENEILSDKLTNLKKEVQILKSLFEKSSGDSLNSIVSLNTGAAAFFALTSTSNADEAKTSKDDETTKPATSQETEPKTSGRGRKKKKTE